MKHRILSLILAFSLLIPLLSACGDTAEVTTATITTNTDATVLFHANSIKVKHMTVESIAEFELNNDQIETLLSVLNKDNWEPDITKTAYDYLFEFTDHSIRYVSELGLFNDPVNNRHLYLTEEEKCLINSLLVCNILYSVEGAVTNAK